MNERGTGTCYPPNSFGSTAQYCCKLTDIPDPPDGHRFIITIATIPTNAFIVRTENGLCAFINRCAHHQLELDWIEGKFFSHDLDHIICSTHGAIFEPDTGFCVAGPCIGKSLKQLDVSVVGNKVFIRSSATTKITTRI